jgi:hypothetical protein
MIVINNISELTKNQFKTIQKIERSSYPNYMRSYQSIKFNKIADHLIDYLESNDFVILLDDSAYLIATFDGNSAEIVDFAGKSNIFRFFTVLNEIFVSRNIRFFGADLRETTSYRLVDFILRKTESMLESDSIWYWESEAFHAVRFRKEV